MMRMGNPSSSPPDGWEPSSSPPDGSMSYASAGLRYRESFPVWLFQRSRKGLYRLLVTDVVDLWEKMSVVENKRSLLHVVPFGWKFLCAPIMICTWHYIYIIVFRLRTAKTAFMWDTHSVVICVVVTLQVFACCVVYQWSGLSEKNRRGAVILLSFLYHVTMPGCNIVLNAQPGRPSEAALFDAFLFICCQFFFNRSTGFRSVTNLIVCLSWHSWKRARRDLMTERGYNLPHLLYALTLYFVSIYVSYRVQPRIELEVARRWEDRKRLAEKKTLEKAERKKRVEADDPSMRRLRRVSSGFSRSAARPSDSARLAESRSKVSSDSNSSKKDSRVRSKTSATATSPPDVTDAAADITSSSS